MQSVDPALPEKGEPGDGESDGVGYAGLAAAVAASDDRGIAEGEVRGLLIFLVGFADLSRGRLRPPASFPSTLQCSALQCSALKYTFIVPP